MALSEVMMELGYSAVEAAKVESDAQHQWDAVRRPLLNPSSTHLSIIRSISTHRHHN